MLTGIVAAQTRYGGGLRADASPWHSGVCDPAKIRAPHQPPSEAIEGICPGAEPGDDGPAIVADAAERMPAGDDQGIEDPSEVRNASIVTVAVAACGSSGTTARDSSSDSTDAIKVGAAEALSGFYAGDSQDSLQGIERAVNDLNAKGGVLGRQLKLVKFDTQDLSPERVMLSAGTLIQKRSVTS